MDSFIFSLYNNFVDYYQLENIMPYLTILVCY
jgi:hypothetical protein